MQNKLLKPFKPFHLNKRYECNKQVVWSGPAAQAPEKEEDEPLLIHRIPMGKNGQQMIVTFGDGPNPNPLDVQAALLGPAVVYCAATIFCKYPNKTSAFQSISRSSF